MKTLCDRFTAQVAADPERVCVFHRGLNTTYGEVDAWSRSIASWLIQQGLQRGDRVALLLPNSAAYVACYLGILRAGGVVVALSPETTTDELNYTLTDAAPRAIFSTSKSLPRWLPAIEQAASVELVIEDSRDGRERGELASTCLSELLQCKAENAPVEVTLNDLAQIIYTSGTTGRPKGVTLSHQNLAANCQSILDYLQLTSDDAVLVTLPFFYSYGNSLLFTHLAVGGRLVLATDFVFWNRALSLIEQQRVTGFSGVPSSFAMLLHKSDFRKRSFPNLRYLTCAGGGLAPATVKQLQECVPHVELFLMYGQTEATARLSTLMPNEVDAKLGSIGRGIPGVDLQVLDTSGEPVAPGEVGEIVVSGDNLMVGYWQDEAATAEVLREEGLWTGDLARVDEDGYVFIVGRKKDIIKSGAYRINPKEIEEVVIAHPGVAEVAVVGMPDPIWGEATTAFVVPSAHDELPGRDDIRNHCAKHLPRHKMIRDLHFVDALPKTASGKIRHDASLYADLATAANS